MPNWCDTTYKIVGPLKSRKAFVAMLDHFNTLPEPLVPNGFGKLWLGCIVSYLGGSWKDIYCRGQILGYKRIRGLILNVESAWGEMDETRHFLQTVFPSLEIYFQTEEPGMCIFETNDPDGTYFPERWLLDWNDEKENLFIYEYFKDLPAVKQYLKEQGILTKDVFPSQGAIIAALEEIQEQRPDDISFMLEGFKVVSD